MSSHRFLLALSILGVGCSGSSSLGSDGSPLTNGGASGSLSPGTGGAASRAGTGGEAQGGTTAGAETGGTPMSTAGKGTGATGSAGPADGGSGGGGTSAGAGGGPADGGTSGLTDVGQAGDGPSVSDTPKQVEDPDASGDGPCASKSARDVLDAIHQAYPELADITAFYDPMSIGASAVAYPFTSDAGYSLVLARGAGDCPAGCIDWDYYYFQTNDSCEPTQVGSYSAHFGPCNGYTVRGEPMWDVPDHTPTAICSETI
jgi:hypothetical protein